MAAVDLHQVGEHQIVLGDSLKETSDVENALLDIKYNWLPKTGLDNKTGIISGQDDNAALKLGTKEDEYSYSGWLSEPSEQPQLVLVYDRERSLYVLEKLTASLNMNIKSATSVPADQIKRYAPLKRPQPAGDGKDGHVSDADLFDDDEDGLPDPANPFDFRNFVSDAKQQAEKRGGISTPLAGSRTPMSGLSSPMPSQAHLADTPPFAPVEIVATANRKLEDFPRRRQIHQQAKKSKRAGPPKVTAKSTTAKPKVLSQEVVVDSDSDSNSDGPVRFTAKGHNRNASDMSTAKSPAIRINDNDVDSDSDSGYNVEHDKRQQRNQQYADVPDASEDVDMSGYAEFLEDDDDEEGAAKNADVADLDLEFEDTANRSPSPPPIIAPQPKRRASMRNKRKSRSPSPPHLPHSGGADDYDDGLAAELEAALEQEAHPDDNAGVGSGIGVRSQEDESDISEEE